MYIQKMSDGGHSWEKINLVTRFEKNGQYDEFKCKGCGIRGKSRRLGYIILKGSYNKSKVLNCPKANGRGQRKRIQIIHCHAYGPQFKNLTPNSQHDIITPPKGYRNFEGGVWVLGVGEPVKVLNDEFKFI